MTPLVALAPGKVNLSLFVAVPRADGLHPLASLVQPVTLADEVRLEPAPPGAGADEVVCPGVEGPNLAGAALAAYREATGWDAPPQRLTIVKRVPVAAGMGGGSGDAAAALRLAAHAAGRPDDPAIHAIAPRLGADVPSQVVPQRCLMTGAGEHVEPLPAYAPVGLVILPSGEHLSTPAVYREADRLGSPRAPEDVHALAHALRAAAADPPPELLHNDLEAAARSLAPSIDAALARVRRAGADHAMVSGSGPTVFGLFLGADGVARARDAARALGAPAVAAEPAGPGFGDPRPLAA
ncbi:MAG TPA: hypothetical protein VF533_22615 [Solirubrobacteraceae bacterium]|jgi:4-diphosphocytidyl-2-C-methyl-D-erythritol kinase